MVRITAYATTLSALCVFVFSSNLTDWQEAAGSVDRPLSDLITTNATWNNSTASPGTNAMQYLCTDTRGLGRDLSVQSCLDAVRQLDIRSTAPGIWGERDTGEFYNIYLPQRYMSTDGRCFVEPVLQGEYKSAAISQQTLAGAGIVLSQRCAGGQPSTGGIARQLGAGNRMVLLLSKYEPAVHCYGQTSRSPVFKKSCQDILDKMDVSEKDQRFGPSSDPEGVNVVLPLTLKAGYLEQCNLRVTTLDKTDVLSMMDVWEVAVAINAMCIRVGKKGVWNGLGLHDRQLSVSVSDYSGFGPSLDTIS
ncbi:MAG: hypothetical protein Q9191_006798 [Dirinaria sp. TL-2023a]